MMMRICKEQMIDTSSFLSLAPPLHQDFSQAFHQTPFLHLDHHHQHPHTPPSRWPPPPSPPPPPSVGWVPPTTHKPPPLDTLQSCPPSPAGDTSSGEGPFAMFQDINLGLMSCTESLGFESSDESSSLDFGDDFSCSRLSSNAEVSSSSPRSSPFCCCCRSSSPPMRRRSEDRMVKKEFPPPLTTMSQNGRRNFALRAEREDGRLKIVRVPIERPEFLYASRQNGRLTMHFVRSVPEFEDDGDDDEEFEEEDEERVEENDEEIVKEDDEERVEEEEKLTEGETEVEKRETTVSAAAETTEEEEREWKIPAAAGVRRCNQFNHIHVWAHQHHQEQRRWVTIM